MEKFVLCRILVELVVTWVFLGASRAQGPWQGFECPRFDVHYGGLVEYSTDPPFYAGATANLSCDVDYEPLENHTMATCYDVGQWVPHVLQCELPCLELELTDFLLASTREHYPGVQIHFTCENDLYHMSGPNYLTCRNGSWSDRLPSCTEPLCDVIQWSDQHLHVRTSRFEYRRVNSTAYFFCDSGWHVVGVESITCLTGGVWSDHYPPFCDRDSSPVPSHMTPILEPSTPLHNVPLPQSTLTSTSTLSSVVSTHFQRTPLPSLFLSPSLTFLEETLLPSPISSGSPDQASIHIQKTPLPSSSYVHVTPLFSLLLSSDITIHLQGTPVPTLSYSPSGERSSKLEEPPFPSPVSSPLPQEFLLSSILLVETASSFHKSTPLSGALSSGASPSITPSDSKATPLTERTYSFGAHPSAVAPTMTTPLPGVTPSLKASPLSGVTTPTPVMCPSISLTQGLHVSNIPPYHNGVVVNFTCEDHSWVLVGESTTECLESGQWSVLPPHCECLGGSSGSSNVGPVAGGVVGGLALIIMVVVVIAVTLNMIKYHRHKGYTVHATEDQVNLLTL